MNAAHHKKRGNQSSARAGRYVTKPGGFRAFVPAPLASRAAYTIAGDLRRQLSEADRALVRLDGSVLTLPNPDLFVFMYVRKEAVLSSQIAKARKALCKTCLPPRPISSALAFPETLTRWSTTLAR